MLDMQKRLTRPFFALMALPATAMGFALSVQISALSWILLTKFGLEIYQLGLVWAAGPIAGILGQPIVGILSDKLWFWGGRRRPFILIGGVLTAMALLALPNIGILSEITGIGGIVGIALIVVLTLDLSINVSFNPTRAVIADLTPEGDERTRGYTWMQTISGSFGVLAYFIGGSLGNEFLIYFGAVLVFVFAIIPPLLMTEPREIPQPETAEKDAHGGDLGRLIRATLPLWAVFAYDIYVLVLRVLGVEREGFTAEWIALAATAALVAYVLRPLPKAEQVMGENLGEFQKIMAAHAFSWVGVQTMFIYMVAFLQFRMPGIEDGTLGQVTSYAFLVLSFVSAVLPALVFTPLAMRMRRTRLHAACLGIMAVGYAAGYAFGYSPVAIYVVMAVLGVGWAAIVSLPFAIMSLRVSKTRMGLYMGIFNLSVVLPQLVASLGVGEIVYRVEDKGVVFLIGAVSLAVSAGLWLTVRPLPEGAETAPEAGESAAGGH